MSNGITAQDRLAADEYLRKKYGRPLDSVMPFNAFLAGIIYARSQMQLYQVNLDEVKGLPDTSNLEPIVGFPKTIVTINGEEFQVLSEPEFLHKVGNG